MRSNSKTLGDETEVIILQELTTSGYSVSIPFGDNDPYDLVVDDGGELYRVQCKTGWQLDASTIRFNTHSQTTRNGEYHESTYTDEIDAFAVRVPELDTMFWVDIDEAASKKMVLRYDAEIDHPSINWASDFEFQGEIT